MEVVTLSGQGTGIWQQTENTSGEGEEKYFLLFRELESNILSFIALSWILDAILNFSHSWEQEKFKHL